MRRRLKVIAGDAPRRRPTELEVTGLTKRFETAGTLLTVLDGIDFSAARGELVCLLGRSGCGKTTLLDILAGFAAPTAGRVELEGAPVTGPGPDRCVVFQQDALFPWLTVRENIAFGLRGRRPADEVRAAVDAFIERVGLGGFGDYLPREISGGMRQRVALARVLILQPRMLLMDEPFGALDAQTREEMQQLLLSLWSQFGHTVLFVTHDVAEAVTLADRVLLMDKSPGRIRRAISIDLPRPRRKEDPAFVRLCRELFEGLAG